MSLSLPLSCFVSLCIFCDDQLLRRSDVFPGTLSCSAFPVCWEGGFRDWSALSWFPSSNTPTLFFVPSVQTFWLKKKKLSQISEAWALTVFICFYFIFVGTCPQGNNKGVYLLVRNNPLAWMTIWSTIFSSSKPWSCLSAAAALKQCILSVCYLPDCANCFIRLLSWSAVLQDDHLHSFYGRWEWGLAKLPNVLKVKWLVNLLIPCKHHRAGG